jgi:23S rRNA (adenine2503-C2)-methyltransferase
MGKSDITDIPKITLAEALKSSGEPAYRVSQIFKWIYNFGAKSFDEMSDLPSKLRDKLKKDFIIGRPALLDMKHSELDGTEKYLLRLRDANTIETVFLPEVRRMTVCLSSQAGCKYGCRFCASAPYGFIRNLTQGEILGQVMMARQKNPACHVTNLVFMGIGEPLDNYDNVLAAIRILNDQDAFGIGARKITVSTCGLIPGIERLGREGLQIELSVSLHSPDDKVRSRMMPVNKKHPIKELMGACRDYVEKTGRVITFEYALMKGINSSEGDAAKLIKILRGMKCKVNTISCNSVNINDCRPASAAEAAAFNRILKKGGINATHRRLKGADIDAACGQLRINNILS